MKVDSTTPAGCHRIRVGDCELAVECAGRGPAVLFVHGFPLNRSLWRHQLDHLAGFRSIAPDLRGMGASGVPLSPSEYSMARYAQDLVEVLDALGEHRVTMCGLSMGGYIAFEFLHRYRDRVRALVLMDTRAEAETEQGRQTRDRAIERVTRQGSAPFVEEMVPKLLGPSTAARRQGVVEAVRRMMLQTSPNGIVGALAAMRDRADYSTVLSSLAGVPTLVVAGEEDAITPPSAARLMASRIPEARLVIVPEAGHLAPMEQPETVTRLLQEFLRERETAGRQRA